MFVRPSRSRAALTSASRGPSPTNRKTMSRAIAEPPGRLDELVERVGQPEVARVHRDERVARGRATCAAGWHRAGIG